MLHQGLRRVVGTLCCPWLVMGFSFMLLATACNRDDDEVDYTEYYGWRDRNTAAIGRLVDAARTGSAWFADTIVSTFEPYTASSEGVYRQPVLYHVLRAADEDSLRSVGRWYTPLYTSTLRCHYTLYRTRSVLDRLERTDPSDAEAMEAIFLDGLTDSIQSKQVEFFENFSCASVVKGWADVLQQMHEGDTWVVAIPWQLGYGQTGQSGSIAPYSDLFFRIELVRIVWWGGTVSQP